MANQKFCNNNIFHAYLFHLGDTTENNRYIIRNLLFSTCFRILHINLISWAFQPLFLFLKCVVGFPLARTPKTSVFTYSQWRKIAEEITFFFLSQRILFLVGMTASPRTHLSPNSNFRDILKERMTVQNSGSNVISLHVLVSGTNQTG